MQKSQIRTYEAAVEYLLNIPKFTSKHSLEETRAFLIRLGEPDRNLRIIHVAGTNGKGSVCAYIRSVLEAAGRRVAVFTSPHLTDIRERFMIEGRMPEKEEFLDVFLKIYDMLDWEALERGEGYHPTFFEYLFFMAMLLFAGKNPDYCILETGLGGRLDATNSVSAKALSVITRISLDHVEYLGHTVEAIAGEKAGILKEGAPVVFADTCPSVTKVIQNRAAELHISAYPVSKSDVTILKIKNKTIDFLCRCNYHKNIRVSLHTIAFYQTENAALAVRAIEVLQQSFPDEKITEEQIRRGLAECFWAGRMEEVLPEVYVDGAHNADGIRAFLEAVARDGCRDRKLLFGVVSDKDYAGMLEQIVVSGLFRDIGIVHLQNGRAASLEALKGIMERFPDCACTYYENVRSALSGLLENRRGERIYIAGSLYLVGEVKQLTDGGFGRHGSKAAPGGTEPYFPAE